MNQEINSFKKFLIENDMVSVDKETMYTKTKPDAQPFVEKLINFQWSKGRKMQRESARCFSKLAESDDPISNKFLREVDNFCSGLKEKYIKETGYTFNNLN